MSTPKTLCAIPAVAISESQIPAEIEIRHRRWTVLLLVSISNDPIVCSKEFSTSANNGTDKTAFSRYLQH